MVDVGLHQLLHDFMDKLQDYYKVEVDKEHMRQMQERKEKDPELVVLNEKMEADRKDRTAEGTFARGSVSRKRPNRRAKRSAKVAEILEGMRRGCEDFYKKEADKEHRRQMQEREEKDLERELLKEQIEADRKDKAKAAECPAMPAARGSQAAPAENIEASVAVETEDVCDVDESGIVPMNIELVMSQALCSRGKAVVALRANYNDIVEALISLSAPTEQLVLRVGSCVCLEGLNAAAFNGRIGTTTAFDEANERWAVNFRCGTDCVYETKLFKAVNIVVLANGSVAAEAKVEGDVDDSGIVPISPAPVGREDNVAIPNRHAKKRAQKKRAQAARGSQATPAKIEASVATETVDEGDVDESGIERVMFQALCSRDKAVAALRANNNDIVEALRRLIAPTEHRLGSRVRLEGLSASAFNGRIGTVTAFDEVKERWAVTFDGGTGDETKLFRAVNIVAAKPFFLESEDGAGIVPRDIALVMSTVPCSRGKAIAALRANNNDIVEAFKWLSP
jgi:NACalpha-BTF3-like transcription factor